MFRDGWFYPGDIAVMSDAGSLKLVGRADDLLNVGGIKFSPLALTEKLKSGLPVDDLCLTTIPGQDGVNQLWVAVVPRDPHGFAKIVEKIGPLLPVSLGQSRIACMTKIPRTATGKVRRQFLVQALQKNQTG